MDESVRIQNCTLVFKCPLLWSELEPTSDEGMRSCRVCDKGVYLAEDDEAVAMLAALGRCVAYRSPIRPLREDEVDILGIFVPDFDEDETDTES